VTFIYKRLFSNCFAAATLLAFEHYDRSCTKAVNRKLKNKTKTLAQQTVDQQHQATNNQNTNTSITSSPSTKQQRWVT
jgi:hypothetical protein